MITFSVSVRHLGLEAACLQAAAGQSPLNSSYPTTEAPDLQLLIGAVTVSADQSTLRCLCVMFSETWVPHNLQATSRPVRQQM